MGTTAGRGSRRLATWDPILAAIVALGLGTVAAVMLVAGHHPWDGRVVASLGASHGLHRGDLLAIGPAVAGVALAAWCLNLNRPHPGDRSLEERRRPGPAPSSTGRGTVRSGAARGPR